MNPEGRNSGNDVHYYSEKKWNTIRVRETKIKLFMLMKLEKRRNELGWLIIYDECIVNDIPEEDYKSMPLHIPPDYTKTLERE